MTGVLIIKMSTSVSDGKMKDTVEEENTKNLCLPTVQQHVEHVLLLRTQTQACVEIGTFPMIVNIGKNGNTAQRITRNSISCLNVEQRHVEYVMLLQTMAKMARRTSATIGILDMQ